MGRFFLCKDDSTSGVAARPTGRWGAMASPRPLSYFPRHPPPSSLDIWYFYFPPTSFPSAHFSRQDLLWHPKCIWRWGVELLPCIGCFAGVQLELNISRPIRTAQPFPFQHTSTFLAGNTGNVKQMHLEICLGFCHYFLIQEAIPKKNSERLSRKKKVSNSLGWTQPP